MGADDKRTDAVLDRLLSNLHRIELEGESMRRPESAPKTTGARSARGRSGAKKADGSTPAHSDSNGDSDGER